MHLRVKCALSDGLPFTGFFNVPECTIQSFAYFIMHTKVPHCFFLNNACLVSKIVHFMEYLDNCMYVIYISNELGITFSQHCN